MTQAALGSHPQHRLQSCIKKRILSNLYQSHVSNSFCCETNSKRVDSYFNMTTSAVLLHLKKSISTLREVQGLFFFLLNTMEDGIIAISNPPTAPVSEAAADSQRFQPQNQAVFASLHSSVY